PPHAHFIQPHHWTETLTHVEGRFQSLDVGGHTRDPVDSHLLDPSLLHLLDTLPHEVRHLGALPPGIEGIWSRPTAREREGEG
uniref:Uncharacterized protein n=1 Tax=Callorhinchus milii TaxID=7868 RepID=A0A4W3JAH0_CALMI